jgi:hypothetical protein
MKRKEEIANKHGVLSGKDNEFDDAILNAMQEYATQCQEDMTNEIQSLIDFYKSDILKLEKEFRDSCSVLTLEKIVTLQSVVDNLESKLNKQD